MKAGLYVHQESKRHVAVLATANDGAVTFFIPIGVWIAGIRLAIAILAWLAKRHGFLSSPTQLFQSEYVLSQEIIPDMQEEIEVAAAKQDVEENGTIPWDQLKRTLDL